MILSNRTNKISHQSLTFMIALGEKQKLAPRIVRLLTVFASLGASWMGFHGLRADTPDSTSARPLPDRVREIPILQHLRPNPVGRAPASAAEETLARMYLPPGFRADLIVSEPD